MKMKETQYLRRSQFILTYGPGSVIESKKGPRLIPSLQNGLNYDLFNVKTFEDFEIRDSRLETAIKNLTGRDAKIVAMPSKESLKNRSGWIYATYVFPLWMVCYASERHSFRTPVLFRPRMGHFDCPVCLDSSRVSAVRFVSACINGHLDEVPWELAVHYENQNSSCRPEYYSWQSLGSSLSDIEIICPDCESRTTMQQIYRRYFPCTGRFPESEAPNKNYQPPYFTRAERNRDCDRPMKILQRQASSLRIPEILTLLTIPQYDSNVSRILQQREMATAIGMIYDPKKDSKIDSGMLIDGLSRNRFLSKESVDTIKNFIERDGPDEFIKLFKGLYDEEKNFIDFIYEEFNSLLRGPQISSDHFSMGGGEKIISEEYNLLPELLVYPINKIRTITSQIGYKRIPVMREGEEPRIVYHNIYLGESFWYPGFEGQGEGLFIKASANLPDLSEYTSSVKWTDVVERNTGPWDEMWRNIRSKPLFIWFHTLSHAIIKSLSLYCGYSAASIRERVYIDRDGKEGGILLYTTTAGEDGSMGGIVGSIKDFRKILDLASECLLSCSNDPLCIDYRKNSGSANGAACYSCLLVSETSCEHRNMYLDRHSIIRSK